MLRTSGLPACPPLARTTALRARMRIRSRRSSTLPFCQKLLSSSPVSGMVARRVHGLDADDAARERLLADQVRELAEQHELHALLARRELERARQRDAVRHGAVAGRTRDAIFICTGANGLVRSRSATPASSAVIVPALMSVLSPSIRKHTAPRARDMPPPSCVPLTRPKRT